MRRWKSHATLKSWGWKSTPCGDHPRSAPRINRYGTRIGPTSIFIATANETYELFLPNAARQKRTAGRIAPRDRCQSWTLNEIWHSPVRLVHCCVCMWSLTWIKLGRPSFLPPTLHLLLFHQTVEFNLRKRSRSSCSWSATGWTRQLWRQLRWPTPSRRPRQESSRWRPLAGSTGWLGTAACSLSDQQPFQSTKITTSIPLSDTNEIIDDYSLIISSLSLHSTYG